MKKLEVRFTRSPGDSIPVGTLTWDRGRTYFEYASDFLATGLNISPFRLPFEPGLFEHRDHEFGPLPGVFDDSLPDGWGLLLMDHHIRSLGLNPAGVSPLDRLAWLGTGTMGALTYHPPAGRDSGDINIFVLHELARQSQEILAGLAVDVLPQLLRAGVSPGGARPKVLVGYNPATSEIISGEGDLPEGSEHWIVKFFAREDQPDTGAVEYAYSLMARGAGIVMPPTRLFKTAEGDRFFGIRRFDRDGNRRCHVHTFGNLIHANFRIPSSDYTDLLKATSLLTRNHQEVLRAFRYMVFNVLTHNRDDHVKNFAFILDDRIAGTGSPQGGDWSLSPAYDLLFTHGPGGEHSMTVAGEGRSPTRQHMLRVAERADLSTREADAIIVEVQDAVARWPDHASAAGVGTATTEAIARFLTRLP